MTGFMMIFSTIASDSLRAAVCFYFIHRLLSAGRPKAAEILAGAAGIAVITAGIYSLSNTAALPFYQLVLVILWTALCASRMQEAEIRMCLFISIFYKIAVTFWQFLIWAGMGILIKSNIFSVSAPLNIHWAAWILNLLLILLTFFVIRKPEMTGQEAFRLASAIALTGFLAVVTLGNQTILPIPSDTLYMWVILSVILMMSVLVLNLNRQYVMEKELARLKSGQAELLERDYTALNRSYTVNAKLFHDFHNHMGTLRQFLAREDYAEAVEYLDNLWEPLREMADTVWTGDTAIDYLINSKMAAASEKRIRMDVQVEFPRNTNIRSADLCAILGNLLDNALEAAGNVSVPEQRFVSLTIRRIHQMIVIKTENSYDGEIQVKDGTLLTTKTEHGLHGWGLKSAQTAAGKYDGMVQTSYDGSLFRAVATLSYKGIG